MDDDGDDFGFDDLELDRNRNQSVKTFANQRRKVKPTRRHAASRNPVKVLQSRDDLSEGLENGNDYIEDEEKPPLKNGILDTTSNHLITKRSGLNVGKVKTRDVELTQDAKKGLESKEDIHGASRSLRVTEKDRNTGIGTEKTNPYDGVKDVMLFHIKGARHVQTRLVEPKTSSMNSGDVFVLVTPKYVHQWNGKNCSIMEKSRGSEMSAVIQQWKELGCYAGSVNIMDEDREKPCNQTKDFWMKLGDKKVIRNIEDVLDDKSFEKGILASNRFYEIVCDDNEDDDAECCLKEILDYTGKVPSKKWLQSNKAYVLDFGTEVYSWIGRDVNGEIRKKAADIGLDHFDKGYCTESNVHPYNPNEEWDGDPSEILPRPSWAVYGRMAEKTESVAFRKKFFDWPDPVDLKVTTVEAKVHAQLTKEYSNDSALDYMLPIRGRELTKPTEEPLMILDGSFIGRGKGMQDMETLFKYGVTLNELTVWQVASNAFIELPKERYGIFYSGESYIIKWSFQIFRTGIRHLKGGKSKQEDTGKDRIVFFFWQGNDCSSSDKGAAALMTIEMDTEEGPQIPVQEGKEPPSFYQLFDGKMIVHKGKVNDDEDFEKTHMYWVRNEDENETCLCEVDVSSASLRSRGCFLILSQPVLYVWYGCKSTKITKDRAKKAAMEFKKSLSTQNSINVKLKEIEEGDETETLWDALVDELDYMSYLEVSKAFNFTPRCFTFDSIHGHFQHREITSSAYHPDFICPFPILQSDLHELSQPGLVFIDVHHKMFLWQGWWPASDDEKIDASGPNTRAEKHRFDVNRKLAMQSIKAYAEEQGRSLSRAYIVFAGCEPLEFKNLFPYWTDDKDVEKRQTEDGHKLGEKQKLLHVLKQLEKDEYSLAELKADTLPEGVDPSRLEQYLKKDEFKQLFGVEKDQYSKVPRWKQIELKKKAGLF